MKNFSLRLRLTIILLILFIVSFFISLKISINETRKLMTEMFDTELYYFAKRLATSNLNILLNSSNPNFKMGDTPNVVEKYMSVENDALAFSIFSLNGEILYRENDDYDYDDDEEEDDEVFLFNKNVLDKKDGILFEENSEFKIVWMISSDKRFVVMVVQEIDYIEDLITDILENLIYPWLFVLPFLIITTFILITKELKPLNKLSHDLTIRDANDSSTLDENTTKELKPVVKALNLLFIKIKNIIEKERRFTSNAAHELKTPLAAIKIQTEVAKLSLEDKDSLIKSLDNIEIGVNRATRLIEQLLSLSRLESINEFEKLSDINWIEVINSSIKEIDPSAKQKNISINFFHEDNIKSIKGEPFILSLLIRNLLDNAIRYNKNAINIDINLQKNNLIIQDNGKGINSEILKNIGERFLRPAGQKEMGSGLGFSIVKQIAKLHNLNINFENINPNGFKINISW